LASALREVLSLPDAERLALGQAALHRVQSNYRVDIVAEKYLNVYSALLK
jgi:glycosyltransferase involved in cell wall biosynthesis